MFKLEDLQNNKELIQFCSSLIQRKHEKLGRFIDITSVDMLFDRLTKAHFERLKFLPVSKLAIYRTSDIGFGYINHMSIKTLQELIALKLVDKNIPIYLRYRYGNIFSSIRSDHIDIKVLLTEDSYLLIKEEENNAIYDIKIGKLCNPNLLYYRDDLDNTVTTIDKLITIKNINSIWVDEIIEDSFISEDYPF